MKEQINQRFIQPLLEERGTQLPRGTKSCDLVQKLVEGDPDNLERLVAIFESLETLGPLSPYFLQILSLIPPIPGVA